MSSYPSQTSMLSATDASKEAGFPTSNAPWYHFHPYSHAPKATSIDLSQVSQANPAKAITVPQLRLSPSNPSRKKRSASKTTKTIPETKREKKNPDIKIDISSFDVSTVPPPVCSCTGVPKICYKWGMGGWQSSCCTISISMYPLPMSTTRPGVRLAGRKMSKGAYLKVLMRLAGEGYDVTQPVDLKNHWARHGTNKFVTIK